MVIDLKLRVCTIWRVWWKGCVFGSLVLSPVIILIERREEHRN